MRWVDGKFDKGDIRDVGSRTEVRTILSFCVQEHERTHGIDCELLGRLCAEMIVEDFK